MSSNNIIKIRKYFESIESRLSYDLILWGGKHFGYYPQGKEHICEKEAQRLMQDLIAENLTLPKDSYALDAGCGQGVVSTYLANKYGWRIDGVTVVPFEVEKAWSLAKKLGVGERTHFYLMDYNKLKFPNNHFDGVYTMESLVHSYSLKKTLNEFYRVLKPGGKFALFEYTMAEDEEFALQEMTVLETFIEDAALASLKKMRHHKSLGYLKEIGFTRVNQQVIDENLRPSFYRFLKISKIPYYFLRMLGLRRRIVNLAFPIELYPLADKGLLHYNIFTGKKPRKDL